MQQNIEIKPCHCEQMHSLCEIGNINTNYDHLKFKLGAPRHVEIISGDNKVTTEWVVHFGDDVFSVFDYKESVLYGEGGANLHLCEIRSSKNIYWSVGGEHGADPQKFIDYLKSQN